jgi:hypothetical protein
LYKQSEQMESIIIQGDSKSNSKLLIELARKLNFKVRKLSPSEMEDLGMVKSIKEGVKSGTLTEQEKNEFLQGLKTS